MKVDVRRELTPQEFIRQLFAEARDGKVSIEYAPFLDEPYTMTYEIDWTAEDAEKLVQRYDALTAAPTHIINRARRYERLVSMNAPAIIINEEGRSLAEELVLYYHRVQRPKPDFARFIEAQADAHKAALQEVRNGRKETHWMWFTFPQLRGLGKSSMSQKYALADLEEAKAYLADIILGSRLRLITEELLKLDKRNPEDIFGDVDAMKLKSCMTLFAHADENKNSVFRNVLHQYFNGEEDDKTIAILAIQNFDFSE